MSVKPPTEGLTPNTSDGVVKYGNVRRKKLKDTWWNKIRRGTYYPLSGDVPLEEKDRKKPITKTGTIAEESFLDHVPFSHYDTINKQIVSDDEPGREKRAVFLDILPADVEGMNEENIEEIADKIAIAFSAITGETIPWIVQIYINDEPVRALTHEIKSYAESYDKDKLEGELPPKEYREMWGNVLDEHLNNISSRSGVFEESRTGLSWRARFRRVKMVLYKNSRDVDPLHLNDQVLRVSEALREAGIQTKRMDGESVYKWLMPWYSGEQEDAYEHMERMPYPREEENNGELPAAFDLGEMCIRNSPISCDHENKCWRLGKRFNRFITLEPYQYKPKPGHWVLQSKNGTTPFDRMPDGSILMYTLIIHAQDKVEGKVTGTKSRAIGDGMDAELTRQECDATLLAMAKGDRLITSVAGIYIDAQSLEELETRTTTCMAAVKGAGFDVIEPVGENGDVLILDTFTRGLPMNFDVELDDKEFGRARKIFDDHSARLIPFLTRGRGTNHHGINFNATGGEPISFDPLNNLDRAKNAHLFMIGSTGSGKTATTINMLLQLLYVHNPRLYLITALPTFGLFGDFLDFHGYKVNRIQVTKHSQPSLPPFADIPLIETGSDGDPNNTVINDSGDRNILGEAEIVAKLMLTGGREKELDKYDSHAEALVSEAIQFAAKTVVEDGRREALTEDVVKALKALSADEERFPERNERQMLAKFATIMQRFTNGFKGQLFNRPRDEVKNADITILELGELAKDGNEIDLAIAMTGQLQTINHIVENDRENLRNTITVIDEAHTLVKNPLIAPYLKKITAMWRTYAGWLWIITQSLEQMPDTTKEILAQPEWWFALNMEIDELERIKKFKDLNEHQGNLLTGTKKEYQKFTEGGVISSNVNTIFRAVPPAIVLALTGTENAEIAKRHRLMKKLNINEAEAAFKVAEEILHKRERFGKQING
ncbi:conjugative transfer ATPase [uncultured Cocleimonas sp.]|uniref:conjugative transfer ATPase n=1 Tax=uncultured Cocleimonas sp. TaxID=1051587 RepID=UPI00260B5426|nr:conjugative transfer ATPase [uncultured Cocleimonas sp.]